MSSLTKGERREEKREKTRTNNLMRGEGKQVLLMNLDRGKDRVMLRRRRKESEKNG